VGFLRRSRRLPPDYNDPLLSDAAWLAAGLDRYSSLISRYYGSPDTIAAGGDARLSDGDVSAALYFYTKAIDTLHSIYVASVAFGVHGPDGWVRAPSRTDLAIVDRYLDTLRQIKRMRPAASPRDSVTEVTHRLRTIATTFERNGVDQSGYLVRLATLAELAPEVDVSQVFWS
jgi:hypothetical protein